MNSNTLNAAGVSGDPAPPSGNDLSESALVALRLASLAEVQKAKKVVRDFFFLPHAPSSSAEVMDTLDHAVDETAFAAMLAIAGSDPMNPRLALYETMPYAVLGEQIPGSRYGFDNPDRAFRHFFVNPAFRYEIRGRRPKGANSTNLVLESCEDKPPGWGYPLTFLRLKDMAIDADGGFVITADSEPTKNRPNHLWLPPGAAHVLIRDTYLDWAAELPTELSVHRVSGPSLAPRLSFESMAKQAPPKVVEHALNTFRFYDWGVAPIPMNTIQTPLIRPAPPGETPWGMTAVGRFRLANDEAMIFTIDPVSAQYLGVMLATAWMVGRDYVKHTGSLNNYQAAANPDGSITYVVAALDPGIQNWLDTDGLHEGVMLLRWEMLRSTPDANKAVRGVKIVKLADVAASLPSPAARFTEEQRRKQIQHRVAGFGRRLAALLPAV